MSQLNLYLPAALEKKIRAEAKQRRVSVSSYVATVLAERTGNGRKLSSKFLKDVIGGWKGPAPVREPLTAEERDDL